MNEFNFMRYMTQKSIFSEAHSGGRSLEIECSGSSSDLRTVVGVNDSVHSHSVANIISEGGSLDDF